MKRKAILLLLSICMTCSALVGCGDNSSTEETSNVELTESTGADEEDNVYNCLKFLDEFSTQDRYGNYHHYFIVQNISDIDLDFTLYCNAYDAKGKSLGLAHGGCMSLSPNDTYVLPMAPVDVDTSVEIDHVEIIPEKFFADNNANTVFGFDTSKIKYSSTLNQDEKKVYVTATNNGTENANVNAAVVFYKDGVPVDVSMSLVHSRITDGNYEFFIKPGATETDYFDTKADFDDYKLYVYAYADFA